MSFTYIYYPAFWYLLFGIIVSMSSTAIVGVFNLVQKKELAGDLVAHAILPGICIAFLLAGEKAHFPLVVGASLSASFALYLVDAIVQYSKLSKDTSMAVVLSIFFGIGLLLLVYIRHHSGFHQAGLQDFILGNVASIMLKDVYMFGGVAFILFFFILFFFKEWELISFDPAYAKAIGYSIAYWQFLFRSLTILAIVVGVQTIGMLLIVAILIGPAVAAYFWTDCLVAVLWLASFLATIAGALGFITSCAFEVPTGPTIVFMIVFICLVSFLCAPKKGFLVMKWRNYLFRRKVEEENMLKLLYELGEEVENFDVAYGFSTLTEKRPMGINKITSALRRLTKKSFVEKTSEGWRLTLAGRERGRNMHNRHILWEAYLEKYLGKFSTRVHDEAEVVEHVMTPEIEKTLIDLVGKVAE